MAKNRLYLLLILGITAGYGWLGWSLWHYNSHSSFTPCPFKNVTGIACPSCGSTRSLTQIVQGNFADAFLLNPLGFIIAAILIIFPFWLLYDIVFAKDSLHKSYIRFEKTLKIKWVALILITLIAANWIWNIIKGL